MCIQKKQKPPILSCVINYLFYLFMYKFCTNMSQMPGLSSHNRCLNPVLKLLSIIQSAEYCSSTFTSKKLQKKKETTVFFDWVHNLHNMCTWSISRQSKSCKTLKYILQNSYEKEYITSMYMNPDDIWYILYIKF